MIKAIIFDCFGVLASDGWLPFKEKYFGSSKELLAQAIELNRSADAGRSSYDEFVKKIAYMAKLSEKVTRIQIENNIPNDELFEFIKKTLKPHYKIGMLSNAGQNWLDEMFLPEQVALFDAVTLSFEIGAIKPDAIMYQTIAKRLGVKVTECVFIDDRPKYCEGASRVGMKSILYEDVQSLKDALERTLV